MGELIDRSLIPRARCEFVVIADTHYMLDPGTRPLEFECRRRQTARVQIALGMAAGLRPDFVLHLGDLVQEYPGTVAFGTALDKALVQIRAAGLRVHHVAGNHDVGDKPDPTMPVHPGSAASLDTFTRRCGPSFYRFEQGGVCFLVLNSQVLNTQLSAAREQQRWLTAQEPSLRGRRTVLFLHMPLYLHAPDEPHLGHYDNIGEPARTWLLEWVDRLAPELVVTGHVHFRFLDQRGPTRMLVAPSVSFTRPGFGHLFTAGPAPQQGRDDTPKLGFYWCRVLPERIDVQFVRTGGATEFSPETLLLTPGPRSFQKPPPLSGQQPSPAGEPPAHGLGVCLAHPLAALAEVPVAWPSVVRQRVRNDYPLLACLELGVDRVRVPWSDLLDPLQRERLALLTREGVRVQAFVPLDAETPCTSTSRYLDAGLTRAAELGATAEFQLAGTGIPSTGVLALLRRISLQYPDMPLALAAVLPGERVAGKQHSRTRMGFLTTELAAVDAELAAAGVSVSAVMVRLDAPAPWRAAPRLAIARPQLQAIDRVDAMITFPGTAAYSNELLAAESCLAVEMLSDVALWVEPLVDLDRTMDVRHGLLNPLCNPRPAFHVLRCGHALLRRQHHAGAGSTREIFPFPGIRVLELRQPDRTVRLVLPREPRPIPATVADGAHAICELTTGRLLNPDQVAARPRGPLLTVSVGGASGRP